MIWTSVALLGVWMSLKAPQPAQAPYQFEFDRIAAQGGVSRAGIMKSLMSLNWAMLKRPFKTEATIRFAP